MQPARSHDTPCCRTKQQTADNPVPFRPMRLRDRDALRAYLRLLRVSEREAAQRAGIAHATLNHLLTGRRASCSVTTARAIEQVLRCPAGLFFETE
jgi:DNA-binding Xre family transcriptional regulator